MSKNKLGQEPVFPTGKGKRWTDVNTADIIYGFEEGASKRFYAACMIMQGLLAGANKRSIYVRPTESTDLLITKNIIELTLALTDELLKQEEL
jgi:hypothetical protein